MNGSTYQISASVFGTLLAHDRADSGLLHDYYEDHERHKADVQVASGDYFEMLATILDKLAQSFPRDSAEQIELEEAVNTLIYLQHTYMIVKKSPDDDPSSKISLPLL